ncbi:uroporphyrinogen-III C-methyltransferase [Aquimarina sp. BL5]|uniref:uroporphyrinogen-III C-methyltransferase n=1 Tax=Aquimarina sp. BL5 TaxID=1714860 RepID=UPI000E4ADF51|nr:uroporphyrinogen-III C-methyltransferase [Aquimarina sp. BL5]AXT52490.1 uroporphyrinogen-III C-methyltransferase [Aquimarina sp. BL5]RKN08465.1 uroporphyrinogen-III C-methyltransferase [Aquimarina sp. BL5]
MNTHISILGLGWLGLPLALQLQKSGYSINGSTAELAALKSLCKYSFPTSRIKIESDRIIGDWESFIDETSTLIINFPPKRIDNIEVVHPLQIEQIIKHTPRSTKVIFVSSTSVYQDSNNLINETEDCIPEKASGRALLKAEQLLHQHFGDNLTILRLAGLIGPQRNPGRLLADKKQLKNPNVPVNLIHQKDAIGLVEAILEQNCFGEIINGCADMHPKRKDFYENAALKLNLPAPIFVTTTKENFKIIDNSKSKALLNFEYQFSNPEWIFRKEYLPEINIIGAGPGNKNLLTLKALEAIEKAEVILHDNLISDEILDVNTHAKRIYVGRKFGDSENQETRQNKINTLMKNHCERGDKVVRLKSGDPYVYGRAAEEARFLKKHKLPFTVIPGISAALAAANICNIPITERNQSNAMLICTAHTADYSFEQLNGIAHMLKAGNTISIYMGLKNLHRIVPKLLEVCKDDRIPVNAISSVSRKQQAIVTGNLGNIEEKITNATIQMPVVFIIGATPI